MKPITPADIEKLAENPPAGAKQWIRVQLDTGGIAAGAGQTLEAIREAVSKENLPIDVQRVGSYGFSYADPVVAVKIEGMPTVLYGGITRDIVPALMEEHVRNHKLLDDHVIANRKHGTHIDKPVTHILVQDTAYADGKTEFFRSSLEADLERRGVTDPVQIVRAMDLGVYDEGVAVQLLPSNVTYTNVLAHDIERICRESVVGRQVIEDLVCKDSNIQRRIVLRNCGHIDPEELDAYLNHARGYQALRKALIDLTPEKVIEELKTSGLRGRGGAGFPTWLKWNLTREQEADQRYVICNADEGDPGAFMDRSVLESDPHTVLEGMILAGYAMGASMGYFYIRAEYPKAVERVEKAIDQAREAGLLGENILGSSFSFNAKIRLGAGAFVCGEETALIASIEGKRGSPSPRPPYPSVRGLWEKPTAINNVETLANIAPIILEGGEWYAASGTEKSNGTKVFAVTGKVHHAQLVEVPMGTTLRQIVFDVCGGVFEGVDIKAVQTGGPSGGVIPEEHLDTPVSYESLQKLGSIMGSGGMIVMDKTDCMVDVAKFYLKFCVDESCGKCAPCRIGGYQMLQIIDRISRGRGKMQDLATIRRICLSMQRASLCGLGQTAPNPVLSTLRYFSDEYEAFIEGGPSYARKKSRIAAAAAAPQPAATATANSD